MQPKRHRRKIKRTVMIVTDSMEDGVRQTCLDSRWMTAFKVLLAVLVIANICFCVYNPIVLSGVRNKNAVQTDKINELTAQNKKLTDENSALNDKVAILSETINQKVQTEEQRRATEEEQSLPKGYPLTGAATMEEFPDGIPLSEEDAEAGIQPDKNPVIIFRAGAGAIVTASGEGTVQEVLPDPIFGTVITVDHGNGYLSYYRNKGDAKVKEGDKVIRGSALYLIGDGNEELGYQISQDGNFINPSDLLEING